MFETFCQFEKNDSPHGRETGHCLLKHSGTHLQQGGHSLQKLQICFLGVDVMHKQNSKLLPEVCQKHLKNIPVAAGTITM